MNDNFFLLGFPFFSLHTEKRSEKDRKRKHGEMRSKYEEMKRKRAWGEVEARKRRIS